MEDLACENDKKYASWSQKHWEGRYFKFKHKSNRAKQCVARHCSVSSRYLSLNFQGHHGHCTGKDHGLEDLQAQVGFAIFQQEDIGVVPRYIVSDFEGAK